MRATAKPGIFCMHDYANINPADFPSWGPVGSAMWWGWSQLNPGSGAYAWPIVDDYLDKAAALGKPVALAVMLYPGPNQDATPAWVYGGGKGWPGTNASGQTFYYPKYNDGAWDTAFRNFVAAFGARYDGDPRINSVWISTLLYGETVISQPDGGELSHNPVRFILNAIDWYGAAFPTTPLYIVCTGTTDRRAIAEYALARGIDLKMNGLVRDAANQHMLRPVPNGGLMDVARTAETLGRPMAFEHAYNLQSQGETYTAMLTGLAHGMELFDTTIVGLETLAKIPGMWAWMLGIMAHPRDRIALWIARDTQIPPPGNGWEHGVPGPWRRGEIAVNAWAVARGAADWQAAPATLTGALYGYGGIGRCDEDKLVVSVDVPAGNYLIEVVVADGSSWYAEEMVINVDGMATSTSAATTPLQVALLTPFVSATGTTRLTSPWATRT